MSFLIIENSNPILLSVIFLSYPPKQTQTLLCVFGIEGHERCPYPQTYTKDFHAKLSEFSCFSWLNYNICVEWVKVILIVIDADKAAKFPLKFVILEFHIIRE